MQQLFRYIVLGLFLFLFSIKLFSQQSQVTSTRGKEFWLGFLEQKNFSNSETKRLDIFISSDRNTSGTISIPLLSYSVPFTITANVSTTINIPNALAENINDEIIDNKGILIQSLDTISVYAINFEKYSADGTLVLPTNSLGTEYRVSGYEAVQTSDMDVNSMALIVATEDNTEIDIIPAVNTLGGKLAGNTYTINLNAGETYQIKGNGTIDITGTIIKATSNSGTCRPFAVFSGNICVNIPKGCQACDALYEQEYPIAIWGKDYLISPFNFASSYTYRVLANVDGTTFTVNGGQSHTLNAGQFYEANYVSSPVYISSNNNISVTQYMQGKDCSLAGDPSQLAINSINQVLTNITFSTVSSTVITQHSVNVTIKTAFKNQLKLDGNPVNTSSFSTYSANPLYSFIELDLTEGSHTLVADSGFIGYVYGTGDFESYAYALGAFKHVDVIPTDTVFCTSSAITLSPPEILTSIEWSTKTNPNKIIGTKQSLTITPNTNDIYIIKGFSLHSGCPKIYQFSVEMPIPPTLIISKTKDSICRFDKSLIEVSVLPNSKNYKYSWYPIDGLSNPSISNPEASPTKSMWYYCTVSTINGCGHNVDSAYIYVRSGNVSNIDVTSDKSAFCSNDSTQLNLQIENIVFCDSINPSYDATIWETISGAIASNICGSVSGNALYFNSAGNRFVTTKSLNVVNGGTVYFYLKIANGAAPCEDADPGEDIVLEYSINNGTSWIIIDTYKENLFPNFTRISITIPTLAQTANTKFRWRQLSNSGVNQDNWDLDNIYIGAINNSTCSFSWSPATFLSSTTIANPLSKPDSSISYIATIVDKKYGCTYRDTVKLDVGQPFTLNTSKNDTVCQLSGEKLHTIPSITGNYSYKWSSPLSLSNDTIFNPIATPIKTTTYYVSVTSIEHCFVKDSVVITVPLISIFYSYPHSDSICEGKSLQLNTSYQKGCGINGSVCNGTIKNIQVGQSNFFSSTNNATLYNASSLSSRFQILYTKAELNALGITSNVTIQQIGFNIANINGSNIFQNFTIKMSCTSTTALSTSFESGLQTVFTPKNVLLTSGVNYYSLDNAYDWDGISNILVEICYKNANTSMNSSTYYSNTTFNSFLTTSSASACNDLTGVVSLNRPTTYFKYCISSVLNTLKYSWLPAAGLNNSNIANPIATPAVPTTYYVTGKDSITGCMYHDSISVSIGSIFTITMPDTIRNCNILGVNISAQPSVDGTYRYKWSPITNLSSSTIQNPIASPSSSVQYNVSVSSEYGCEIADSIVIQVPSLALFYATPITDSICQGQSIQCNTFYQKSCGVNGSVCNGIQNTVQIGTDVLSSSATETTIYKGINNGAKMQMLYTKAELNAAGILSATTITALGFTITSIFGSNIYQNFSIKMGCTPLTALSTTFETGLQTVFTPKNIILSSGINYYNFTNTYDWDGISNIIVEICYNNASTSTNSSIVYSTTQNNSVNYATGNSVCNILTGTTSTSRANSYFKYCSATTLNSLTYKWTPSIGISIDSIKNPVATPSTNTTYHILATDSVNGCVFSDSVNVTVGLPFTINMLDTILNCSINGIKLAAMPVDTSVFSYSWSPSSSLDNYKIATPIAKPSSTTLYTVTISSKYGCSIDDSILIITPLLASFNTTPKFDTICIGQSTQLNVAFQKGCGVNGSKCNGQPIAASIGTGTLSSSANNVSIYKGAYNGSKIQILYTKAELNAVGITSATTFSDLGFNITLLTGNNIYQNFSIKMGCTSLSTFTSNFETGLQTVFNPKNVILSSGINYYSFNNLYDWDGISNIIIEICYNNSSISANSANFYTTTVNNSVLYTVGNGVCSALTGTVSSYRANSYFKYCSSTSIDDLTFKWSPSLGLNNDSIANPIATPQENKTYKVVAFDSLSGCVFSDSIAINAQDAAILNLGNDTVICPGQSIIYDLGNGFNSFTWNDGSITKTKTVSTNETIWVNAINICGSQKDTVNIRLNTALQSFNLGNDTNICDGSQLKINAYNNDIKTYQWQDNSTDSIISISTQGIYSVTVTNNCGTLNDSIKVTIQYPIDVSLGKDSTLCPGQSIQLDAGLGYNTFMWQDNSTLQTYTALSPGIYSLTASNACGIYSDSITISYLKLPQISLGNDTYICKGDSMLLSANPCDSCTFHWQDGSSTATYNVKTLGIYSVSSQNRCATDYDTIVITEKYLPKVVLGNDTSFCKGQQITIKTIADSSYTYTWQNGSKAYFIKTDTIGLYWVKVTNICGTQVDSLSVLTTYALPQTNIEEIIPLCSNNKGELLVSKKKGYTFHWENNLTDSIHSIELPGNYSVTVSDSNGCKASFDKTIYQSSKPYINLGNDSAICLQSILTITLPTANDYNYVWRNGSTLHYITVKDSGLYSVTASNKCGIMTDSIHFSGLNCDCFINVPTAFSPNNDNNNDILYLVGNCMVNINFFIYDRWGQMVFESHDISHGWDGTFKGKKLDMAVFVYSLTAESLYDKGNIIKRQGNISLIR